MTRLIIRHASRLFASLFAILAILIMFGVWGLSSLTLSSKSWTPYIERMMEQVVPYSKVVIKESSIDWDHKKLTLTLQCKDLLFRDGRGNSMISFPEASVKLSLWSLLRGNFIPQEFNADQALFWLMRHKNRQMTLGFEKPKVESKDEESQKVSSGLVNAYDFLENIGDDITQPLSQHAIHIKKLDVKLYDEKTRKVWQLNVPELHLDHKGRQVTGTARVILKDGDKETSAVQLTYGYERKTRFHSIGVTFQDIRLASFSLFAPDFKYLKMIDIPVSGHFSVKTDRELNIARASIKLDGQKGRLVAPKMWEDNPIIEKAGLTAYYNEDKGKLKVERALIDFGGPILSANLDANITKEFQQYWFGRRKENNTFELTLKLTDLPMNEFKKVWPKVAVPNARDWIAENMTGGVFEKGHVTLYGKANYDDIENMQLLSGRGAITAKGGRIVYMKGMPAVENVDASATFDLKGMDVTIEKGHTGAIQIKPFTLQITGLDEETQYIKIPLHIAGSVADVLTLIDAPPLGYASQMDLVPSENIGSVDGVVTFTMPLLNDLLMDDIGINALAQISDFSSGTLIPRIELSKGALDLVLTLKGLKLDGIVLMNEVPAKIKWETVFNETKAKQEGKPIHTANVEASPEGDQWKRLYGIGKYLTTKGGVPTKLTYQNMHDGVSHVMVEADLTESEVTVDQLAWVKPPKIKAGMTFGIDILKGKDLLFKDIKLSGINLNVKGNVEIDEATSALTKVHLDPFVVGRSHASLIYETPVDQKQKKIVKVTGRSFDISALEPEPVEDEQKQGAGVKSKLGQPQDMFIKVKKLHTSEDGFMAPFRLEAKRSEKGWESFDLEGKAQGAMDVMAQLYSDEKGGKQFRASTEDLGIALKGFGAGDNVKGGVVDVKGESLAKAPYEISGKLKVNSFVIKDWPFLARLFNALSPFGFVDLITGDSSFDHLRGYFTWNGTEIELKDMNAAGSVVGLNIKGRINTLSNSVNVHGTAVPFSFVNSIIGSIPLIGDVITGGKGEGVIAAAFNVTGQLSEPEISVNPASLLTPGFLRNLFFSSDDGSKKKKSKKKDNTPYPKVKVE